MKIAKAFFPRFAVLAVAALTLFLTSCDTDIWWRDERLVGVWHTSGGYTDSYTLVQFYDNHEGEITQYDYGKMTDRADFDWNATRYGIEFYYYDRASEHWEIEFEGRNAFRLYFDDGDYIYFTRDY